MLEDVRKDIVKLIALYEREKAENIRLKAALEESKAAGEAARQKILELESRTETLKLSQAFSEGGDKAAAKETIDKLIRDIDKCISWLES